MASKVLSVLLGVLVLTGCAGMGSQTVKPEKLVLDWKDFYPSDFLKGCNQSLNLDSFQKRRFNSAKRLCYQTSPLLVQERYSLVVDIFSFDPEQQMFFDAVGKEEENILESYEHWFSNQCSIELKEINSNAIFCSDHGKQILFSVNYITTKGYFIESRLETSLENVANINDSSSEYKTSMRILNDKNLIKVAD